MLKVSNFKTILEAFARIYNNVTPKHQRRLHLKIISERHHHDSIMDLVELNKISERVFLIQPVDKHLVTRAYESASVMLLPVDEEIAASIPSVFNCGIPIICFDNPTTRQYLDATCAMLIPEQNHTVLTEIRLVDIFAEKIEMLYFDPEVQKVLKKGAVVMLEQTNTQNSGRAITNDSSPINQFAKTPIDMLMWKIEQMAGHNQAIALGE